MKTLLALPAYLLAVNISYGQLHRFSISPELNVKHERFRFNDPAGYLIQSATSWHLAAGLSGRWYHNARFTSELAVLHNFTPEPILLMDYQPIAPHGTPARDWQLALRQYYHPVRWNMGRKSQGLLGVRAGIAYMGHRVGPFGGGQFTINQGGNEFSYRSVTNFERGHTFSLETGLNAHYFVGTRWHFSYHYTWLWGAGVTARTDVTYSASRQPESQASITSNGTGRMWGLAVGYCFGGPKAAYYEKRR